jgi:hypothetical protein
MKCLYIDEMSVNDILLNELPVCTMYLDGISVDKLI